MRYNTTDQLQTGEAVIRWYGNICAHLSSHQIIIFPNILIPPFSFHIRTRLFHHAWLMTAILVHFMLQWRSSRVKKRPNAACDIQFIIRKKSRLWAHLDQFHLFATTAIFLLSRKYWTICISHVSWTRFVERNFVKCPKTSGLIWAMLRMRMRLMMLWISAPRPKSEVFSSKMKEIH